MHFQNAFFKFENSIENGFKIEYNKKVKRFATILPDCNEDGIYIYSTIFIIFNSGRKGYRFFKI